MLVARVLARRFSAAAATPPADLSRYGAVLGGARMDEACARAFDTWHGCVAGAKQEVGAPLALERLRDVVADDCVFKPPTYYTPWAGGDETTVLLACAAEVFGPSFSYGRQWVSEDGREWALEFSADVADTGKRVDGVDLVSLDGHGKIKEFAVLARPPNGVAALKDEMMRRVPPRMLAFKARRALGF